MKRIKAISALTISATLVCTAVLSDTVPRYTVENAESEPTVSDGITGLMWQQSPTNASSMPWKEALAHCETLEYAGQDNWRLPKVTELSSIVDEKREQVPAINAVYFKDFSNHSGFWTSTTARNAATSAYVVYFNDQNTSIGRGGLKAVSKTSKMDVICVRSLPSR